MITGNAKDGFTTAVRDAAAAGNAAALAHEAELRAINERLVITSVRQHERAETASKTAEHALKSSELYRLLARNFPNGIVFLFDSNLRHIVAEGSGLADLGLSRESIEGKTLWEGLPHQTCHQLDWAYRAALAGESVVTEVTIQKRQGTLLRTYQVHALPVRDEAGNIVAGMAMTQDVTKARQVEEIIRWQANHDALTGLPNRALLRDRLEHALAISEQSGEIAALLFLDLDRFKLVNDTLGHAIGDHLLRAVAGRLTGCLRVEDTVARIGGDEFLVLLPSLRNREAALHVAQKVSDVFTDPVRIDRYEIAVTASIGISVFPVHGRDADTLLRAADAAMYQSKERRPGGFLMRPS